MIITTRERDDFSRACTIAGTVLRSLQPVIQAGVLTGDIAREAERLIEKEGGTAAFKGYRGFPGTICISLNEEVVHGIPSKQRTVKEGDLVSLDVGVRYNRMYGDCAATFPVGRIRDRHLVLLDVTRQALKAGIAKAVAGNRTGDIAAAIQGYVEANGFSVVRDLAGHGIGSRLHDYPEIPNFGMAGRGDLLVENMALAVEPMVNELAYPVKVLSDGWTIVTRDGGYSCHFEETILVGREQPLILTGAVPE